MLLLQWPEPELMLRPTPPLSVLLYERIQLAFCRIELECWLVETA